MNPALLGTLLDPLVPSMVEVGLTLRERSDAVDELVVARADMRSPGC
jgi:hypothetical protein